MSLEVFGDGGDGEDLLDLADKCGYQLFDDGLFREDAAEKGMTTDQMWEYIEDRRMASLEDMESCDY